MVASGLRSSELHVLGIRSPVIETGAVGAPEAIVFVHGNPGSRLDWEDLAGRVGGFARAVAFDLPGFGEADKPSGFDYSVPGFARFIAAALADLGVERAHLVAHDFGGSFGLAWAAAHPQAFRSLLLTNAPPGAGYRWYLLAKVWKTPLAGELLHRTLTRRFFDLNVTRGRGRPLPRAMVDRMWRDYDGGTRRTVLRLYRASDARRLVPAPASLFRELDRPTLIVWGRRDPYIPERFCRAHRLAFPKARIEYLQMIAEEIVRKVPS